MRKLKVVQIGMNHEHAPGKFRDLMTMTNEVEIAGVVDESSFCHTPYLPMSRNEKLYEAYPKLTMDELFAMPDLDLVLVEVPNLDLVPVAAMCAERGIPMHMDKPAGLNLEDYKKVLDTCREKNVPLQMGYMFRGNPAMNMARQLVKAGALGDVYSVAMDMNHNYGGENYPGYIKNFPGGVMFNLGCHVIDYIISLFGAPSQVIPVLESVAGTPDDIKDNTMAVLQYPGIIATVTSCCRRGWKCTAERRLRIEGTRGRIEFMPVERFDGKSIEMFLALKEAACGYPAGENILTFAPQRNRYVCQLRELINAVRENKALEYSLDHDYLVHKASLAASGIIKWS